VPSIFVQQVQERCGAVPDPQTLTVNTDAMECQRKPTEVAAYV